MIQRFAGRFALLRPLGRGGMGDVYLARDLTTGGECALKRLPDRMRNVAPRLLRREFEALSRVRHPAVVAVHDVGFAPDGTPWLSMEYVPGLPADRAVARGDWRAASIVAAEVLQALEALHAADVRHGDLKPANVLVVAGPSAGAPASVRLLDFGLATLGVEEDAGHRGTPGYAAPEVVSGAAPSAASDLYGLGVCLYAMIAGRPPFAGEDVGVVLRAQRAAPPPALPLEEAGAPPAMVSFVLRLLAQHPAERPTDAREARLELETIVPSIRRPLAERLKAVRVIGRERELARLESWIAAAPERPRVIELTGPPGSGKTTLLRELSARAALSGRPVVQVSGGAQDRTGALADDLARRLAAACGEEPGASTAAEWAARCAARGSAALVMIDDVERLDTESFAWLRRLALDERAPLLWVWARRELRGEALEAERVLHHAGVAERVALGSLGEEDASRLAAARLGRPAPAALEDFLWRGANGHPGLTVALLEAAAGQGAIVESEYGLDVRAERLSEIAAPEDFDQARLARLAALPQGARDAAAALAVSASALDREALAALAPAADAPAQEALVDADLATRDAEGRLVLHPPSLGPRILAGLDGAARQTLHRAAAARPGVDPARAFRHHAEAGDLDAALAAAELAWARSPDRELAAATARLIESQSPELAATWHDRAAQSCFEASRYALAIPHLERTLELDSTPDRRGDRWARLSTAYLRSGRLADVAKTLERAKAEGVSGGPLSRLLGNEASRLRNSGDIAAARAVANEALGLATVHRDGFGIGVAATSLAMLDLSADRIDEADANVRRAVEGFQSAGHGLGANLAAGLAASVARARGRINDAIEKQKEILERARTNGHRLIIGSHLTALQGLFVEAGRWAESESPCAEALRLALEDGRSPEAAAALASLGIIEAQLGKTRSARRHARAALRLGANASPTFVATAWRALAQAERAAGHLRNAERAARRALDVAIEVSEYDIAWSRIEFGLVRAAAGGWGDSADAWSHVVSGATSADVVAVSLARVLSARAKLRQPEMSVESRDAVEHVKTARPFVEAMATLLRAEIALTQSRPGEAIEAGRAALAAFDALPAPAERAAAALDLARLAPANPALKEAVLEWLDVAARGFERLGDQRRRRSALSLSVEWLKRGAVPSHPPGTDNGLVDRVTWLLGSLTDLGELTQRAMRAAVEQLGAERGLLLLADPETGQLVPMAEHGVVDPETRRSALGYSRHVVSQVTESGGSVLIVDAPIDPRAASDSVEKMQLLSILCVPMFVGGRVVGAVYLDDSRRPHAFGQAERRMLEGFSHLMAVAIEKAQGHEEVRRVNELLEGENLSLRQAMGAHVRVEGVIGSSAPMQKILGLVEHAARVNTTVLMTGENGTGKELIARTLHHSGKRRLKPFVAVNCGAITETLIESELFGILPDVATGVRARPGRFVQADGGTLFLDEIGEMPLNQQVALLAVIANREVTPVGGGRPIPVDVRIIAATNKNLRRLIEQGAFREDLYYRLNVIEIEVPPLRERKADIPALAQHFLEHYARQQERELPQLSPEFLAVLMQSDWPGNVRGLQNYVERVLAMTPGRVLHPDPLPPDLQRRSMMPRLSRRRLSEAVGEIERKMVGEALERARGNQSHAARELGLTEQAMRYRLRKYGIASARRNRRVRRK